MSPRRAFPAGRCLLLWAALLGSTVGAGIAFGRDESRAERIRGDDDPVLIPRWVALGSFTLEPRHISDLDPQSTGSVKNQARRSRPRCDTLAWFPDREPGDDLRDSC